MDEAIKMWMPVTKTASGKLVGILSDTSIDRDDEFMTKELLDDWSKNTSLKALANHENKMEKWVGGWSNLKVVEKNGNFALIGEPWFFSKEANPLAEQIRLQVLESVDKGENAGISIAAIPKQTVEKECSDKKKRRGYVKAELLEGTWVPIQSNRNASFGHIAKAFGLDYNGVNLTEEVKQDGITKEEIKMVEETVQVQKEAEVAVEIVSKENEEVTLLKNKVAELEKSLVDVSKVKDDLQKELDSKAVLKATVETVADIRKEQKLEPTMENMLKIRSGLLNR